MAILEALTLGALIARGITTAADTARGLREIKAAKADLWKKGKVSKEEIKVRLANAYTEDIKWVQESLAALGFYKGDVDGIKGERTDEALIKFQMENNLQPDAIPGILTISALINKLRLAQEWLAAEKKAQEIQE